MSKLNRRCDELEYKIAKLEHDLHNLQTMQEMWQRKWKQLDDIIEARMNGKMRMMVIDNLSAYLKGKSIKADIDHIEEVFKK